MDKDKITWIREYRTKTGCSLQEGLEAYDRESGGIPSRVSYRLVLVGKDYEVELAHSQVEKLLATDPDKKAEVVKAALSLSLGSVGRVVLNEGAVLSLQSWRG